MKYLNDDHLLDLRFSNGMLILPFIRYSLMENLNGEAKNDNGIKRNDKLFILKALLKNFDRFIITKRKILLLSSTLFNIREENKGNSPFKNSLDGYYYDLFPNDTLLFEDWSEDCEWRTKDSYDNLTFFLTYVNFVSSILAKLCQKIRPIKNPHFSYILQKYPHLFNDNMLGVLDYTTRIRSFFIKKILRYIDCRVMALNCASYGGQYAVLNKIAHELGIIIIEFQHGAITQSHTAYHADPSIVDCNEYKEYLPDCLFTFGNYWHKNIEWKYDLYPVGNAFLNHYKSKCVSTAIKNDYLVISQPIAKEELITFTKQLAVNKPSKKIVYRLHPRDSKVEYSKAFEEFTNIVLSTSEINLYEEIVCSSCIVGSYSTCLFEALAFGKKLVIIDTPLSRKHFPSDLGIWVKTVSDMKDNEDNEVCTLKDEVWAEGFEEKVRKRFSNYLSK